MNIGKYLKKYGLKADDKTMSDYYYNYVHLPSQTTGSAPNKTSTTASTTGTYITSSTVSSGFTGSWDAWTKEEKKALAKVGFTYDKKTNEWILDITTTIRIPQLEGFQALSSGSNGKPTDQMIALIKQAKEQLIEKLTAKIVLAELIRPREIKE